jgi:hypothetical protein
MMHVTASSFANVCCISGNTVIPGWILLLWRQMAWIRKLPTASGWYKIVVMDHVALERLREFIAAMEQYIHAGSIASLN